MYPYNFQTPHQTIETFLLDGKKKRANYMEIKKKITWFDKLKNEMLSSSSIRIWNIFDW